MKIHQSETGCRTENVREQDIYSHISAGGALAEEAAELLRWKALRGLSSSAEHLGFDEDSGEDCYKWSSEGA